jgi:hypothetical protein
MNIQEARSEWQADKAGLEERGVVLDGVTMYMPDEWRHSSRSFKQIAMDAQPTLSTDPSAAIPAMLTTMIDPKVIRVVFTPLNFAKILTEQKNGDWLEETRIFPVVEETGEVSSYGDFNNNGRAGVNLNFPNFQSYLFQTFIRYGERELERAGLARINYVGELGVSAADLLNRFQNLSYAFGISGLQNYGIINNPYLSAYLTPATKAAGGTSWFVGNAPNATANEVYNDIVALVEKLVSQTNGTVELDDEMTLAMSPSSALALRFANSFGVYVRDLLKEGFPNMKVMTAPQYGQQTTTNPQGYSTAGNAMQLIVKKIQGQEVAYAAFNEKLRAHKIIPEPSAWMQKMTSGTWSTILRMPLGVTGMLGI